MQQHGSISEAPLWQRRPRRSFARAAAEPHTLAPSERNAALAAVDVTAPPSGNQAGGGQQHEPQRFGEQEYNQTRQSRERDLWAASVR
ncbi:hypothetical protein MNEG_10574, partial [Monoraphidium neglectum]